MNRSFSLFLVAFASVVSAPAARADLDSLLGDWANAASNELGSPDDAEVSLAPASAVDLLTNTDSDDDDLLSQETMAPRERPAPRETMVSQAPSQDANQQGEASTLTGHHAHAHAANGYSVMPASPPAAMYQTAAPSVNPYYAPADCDCGNQGCSGQGCESTGACGSAGRCGCETGGCQSCSGGCGELISRCESGCPEGKSECRPHQRPNLPSSTFLELFRSRNSYSNVWAGYAEETRLRVRNRSPHLDGTWRCNGCGAMLEPNQVGCSCGGGCSH